MQTRRSFVRGAGAGALALVVAPDALARGLTSARRAPLISGGRFPDGVLSGDPRVNGITLLTRVEDLPAKGSVLLEVARDKGFNRVVASQRIGTSRAINGSVKARVGKLAPHEEYFYRFATASNDSAVGRFRTALPADSNQPVNFAFFSCQDFTHGFYNAHTLLADLDLDFVINLGDYIYDETYHSRKGGTGVRDDGIGRPYKGKSSGDGVIRAAMTLPEYRAKYALYRTDQNLREMHAAYPMVSLWDDHEVQNNYAGNEPDGGLPAREAYSPRRRRAGYKAYFENMPHFPAGGRDRIYRTLKYGKTVELFVMDQRQYRDDQPCDDAVATACEEYNNPRRFLGRQQMNFIKNRLSASNASWKVMANELTIMPTKVLGDSFFTFDGWQGYPGERTELLRHIIDRGIQDVIFVTGDIHTFIAGDVRTGLSSSDQGELAALEFVGGSITSQNLGETTFDAGGGQTIKGNDRNPNTPPALIDALRGINPWVDQADFDHHGFGLVRASPTTFDVTLKRLATIKKKSRKTLTDDGFRYQVARGQKSIKGVNGPPAQA